MAIKLWNLHIKDSMRFGGLIQQIEKRAEAIDTPEAAKLRLEAVSRELRLVSDTSKNTEELLRQAVSGVPDRLPAPREVIDVECN